MKVIFFCENKNSIILSNKILDNPILLNSNINIEFITCDWSETITKWINSLNVNIHVYNIMDDFIDDRNSLLKNIDKATKSDIIKNVFIKYLKINRPDLIIIYNDSSLRGYACSIAARQLNIHRFLIQDGHLNFDSKSNLLYKTDQNFFYGQTKPERIFVWGKALKEKIIYDHGCNPNSIIISGKVGGIQYNNIDKTVVISNNSSLKILIADQPLCDQNKIDRASWKKEFKDFINSISNYDLTIKFHPSTLQTTLDESIKMLPKSCAINTTGLITSEYIKNFDLVITYFSSVYINCLEAEVPVIFYNLKSCDILFPEIKNKLFFNAYSLESLVNNLNYININRTFKSNENGLGVDYYIEQGNNATDIVIDNIFSIYNESFRVFNSSIYEETNRYLDFSIDSNYIIEENPKKICIIGDDFSITTGVAYPILNYFNYMKLHSDSSFQFILVKKDMPVDYIVNKAINYSYIIINSLAFFFRYKNAVEVIKRLQNKFIYVYAHETEYVIKYEQKNNAANFNKFAQIAPKLFFLCVSRRQKELFKSYGWVKSSVVYNCIDMKDVNFSLKIKPKTIMMSGTIQDRKGVDLFCKVADILSVKGYKFIWCGALTPKCTTVLSKNVEWIGFKTRIELLHILSEIDIFFMSSFDDPFPLSLLEASALNKKIVSYDAIGSYEALHNSTGYVSFCRYTPLAAINAIERVASIKQEEVNTSSLHTYFTPHYFSLRMNLALKAYRCEARIISDTKQACRPQHKQIQSIKNKETKNNTNHRLKKIIKLIKTPRLFFRDFIKKRIAQ